MNTEGRPLGLEFAPGGDLIVADDNGIVCEGEVTYTHHDGRSVTVPFCNVFEAEAGLISLYRIYIDMGPVFAAT